MFQDALKLETELFQKLLRDNIRQLDAGAYALDLQLLEGVIEHEKQKIGSQPAFAIPRDSGKNVAPVEVTVYNTRHQFVITFHPYRGEIVGFPAPSDALRDEIGDSRPVLRLIEDAFHRVVSADF